MEATWSSPVHTWLCTSLVVVAALTVSVHAQLPLYPFGFTNNDNEAPLGAPTEIKIPFPLKYYGQTFTATYITTDGILAFDKSVRYNQVADWRKGVPNLAIDLPFIAPFHYQGHVPGNPDAYKGKIYYREIPRTEEGESPFLDELDDYMNKAVVGVKNFQSQFALVVTWANVTNNDCFRPDCPANTFQLVLVANEKQTFAIFNYHTMEIPFNDHQLAGMNGGYRRGWTDVIPCDAACVKRNKPARDSIASLTNRSGSDVAGRYIMRLDDDIIVRGGCIPSNLKAGRVEASPPQTTMLGGQMLSVSGECSTPGSPVYCRFAQDDRLISEGFMESEMKGRCPVPLLTTRGEVSLEVSSKKGSWKHSTTITIILPSRLPRQVTMSNQELAMWAARNPTGFLTASWRPSDITSKSGATVDINVIGYRETGDQIEMKTLTTVGSDIRNAHGTYQFDPSKHRCQSDCDQFEIGVVQIRLNDQDVDNRTVYHAINTGPVPLGWYVNSAMTSKYGAQWPEEKCKAWDSQDRKTTAWLDHLLPCPCTLTQALADWGRWQPDVGCNMFNGSTCTYHVDALHCVRSVHPSHDGAGNQCCYEYDGSLRYAADSFEGSTPDKSHDWGAAPYNTPGRVPSFSHWIDDVITFYYCCLWTEPVKSTVCKYYMDRRPTKDCVAYVPPASATVYGDPHITTFDGTKYYFGGAGDFWLLQSDVLKVQGKFEEADNQVLQLQTTQLKPSVLKSVVMWTTDSDVVTISIAPLHGPVTRKLDVTVNIQRRFFEDGLLWQDFNGVSIVNNAPVATSDDDKSHSNFTVLFNSGAGVQIAQRQGLLHVFVVLPPHSQEPTPTQGLLGTWDGDDTNDFTPPNGSAVAVNASQNDIYSLFALKWQASKEESKFQFPTSATTNREPYFGDPASVPYKSGVTRPTGAAVTSSCGTSSACARDYYMTNDERIARASLRTEQTFEHLQRSQTKFLSCGLLDIPMASKSSNNYSVGSVVTVKSCRPDNTAVVSKGPLTYNCSISSSGGAPQWSPTPDPTLCGFHEASPEKASNVGMIIGIAVACTVIIAAVVIIVIVVIVLRRRRKGQASETKESERPTPARRTRTPEGQNDEEAGKPMMSDPVRMSDVQRSKQPL